MRNAIIGTLLAGGVGCAGTTTQVMPMQPAAPTQVNVAVNIIVGQPLVERDARVALAAHGRWESTSLGELWLPDVGQREEFVPYATHGQWIESARGPQWQSTFGWGPIVFGYGQWVRVGRAWGWRFGARYNGVDGSDGASVLWRRSGSHVGWCVAGADEWYWLALDELYGAPVWRRVVRGPAAAPLLASSVEVAPESYGRGTGAAPIGGLHRADEPGNTVGAPARLERAPGEDRWATVVIRDERANERFEELQSYEYSLPATMPTAVPNANGSPATPQLVARARANPAVQRAPEPTSRTMWSDQERTRAPIVANINPSFRPNVLVPMIAPAQPAPVLAQPAPQPVPTPAPPSMGGGGYAPAIVTQQPSPVSTPTVPSTPVVRVSIPTMSGEGAASTVRVAR